MKNKIIASASALALMLGTAAYAEVSATDVQGTPDTRVQAAPAENNATNPASYNAAVPATNDAAQSATDKDARTSGTGGVADTTRAGLNQTDTDEIKAVFIGDDAKAADGKLSPVLIRRDSTAHGMIGAKVANTAGDNIATVKDIIIDKNGKALTVVVSDGGMLGIGDKLAAFDYSRVVRQNPDGTVVMTLTQDMIDKAAEFSYDEDDRDKANVIPAGGISVAEALDGAVLDAEGRKVADVDNISFSNADASKIIVSFNKTLGLGGDLAALDYDDVQMTAQKDDIDFKLSANQAAQFRSFTESVDDKKK